MKSAIIDFFADCGVLGGIFALVIFIACFPVFVLFFGFSLFEKFNEWTMQYFERLKNK